ncbi:MAG: S-adenosylmethionine:tRNA ribosyltransferase-isomerase, partial [Vulcanimicrobiaceae bacterium]
MADRTSDLGATEAYRYALDPELIARKPATPRDSARLLVVGSAGALDHRKFRDLPQILRPDDLLVINETRVLRARLHGRREPTG